MFANAWIVWSVKSLACFDGSLQRSQFTESFKSSSFFFAESLHRGMGSPASCANALALDSEISGESHKLSSRNQLSTSSTTGFFMSGFNDPFGSVFPQSCKTAITDGSSKLFGQGSSLLSQFNASSRMLFFIVVGR